ncbi:50S ribosomal protein L29 [Legionella beliardensis]|uniref:Large ribosomal subunit protein uL29 n=1 Tax=Legionella beliardensis TaxID=91822 RepID=A0A378HZP0_9GAMM|nr:50S ribosomal protein L29 [Legionella beliardensis]STX27756.1 50S ribosomal protein L29 [Legionella beliardensis]
MKNISELRELSLDQLNEELIDIRKLQFKLRMKKANGLLDKTHPIKEARKAIARVKTIMTEKVGKTYVEE